MIYIYICLSHLHALRIRLQGTGCSHDKCFTGTNRSQTFSVATEPVVEFITFGSGTVETAVATDVVKLADVQARRALRDIYIYKSLLIYIIYISLNLLV